LPRILLFLAAQNQQKTDAHFMHLPFFFFFLKRAISSPSQKELTANLKEKPTTTIKSAAISLENT